MCLTSAGSRGRRRGEGSTLRACQWASGWGEVGGGGGAQGKGLGEERKRGRAGEGGVVAGHSNPYRTDFFHKVNS